MGLSLLRRKMPRGIPKSGINKGWFKKGHIAWGTTFKGTYHRHYSKARNEKIRLALKGRKLPEDVINKMKKAKKGQVPWNKNKKLSKKTRKKMSKSRLGKPSGMLGKHHTKEWKKEHRKRMTGKNNPFFGKHHTKKERKKMRLRNTGKHFSKKTRRKKSKTAKKNWQNPKIREKTIRAILSGSRIKPNKAELKLNIILQKILPKEYAINVRAEIMILGRKIPDFVNITGKKKIIELFGTYWHSDKFIQKNGCYEDTEKGKIAYFRKLGWDTLIVWEKELGDLKRLKRKILKFNKGING